MGLATIKSRQMHCRTNISGSVKNALFVSEQFLASQANVRRLDKQFGPIVNLEPINSAADKGSNFPLPSVKRSPMPYIVGTLLYFAASNLVSRHGRRVEKNKL